jgi:hypothetical protein
MSLEHFFRTTLSIKALGDALDALTPQERMRSVLALNSRQQATLFEAAKGHRSLRVADMVAADRTLQQPVIHHGKNSLLLFTQFQKRFCRPTDDRAAMQADQLWGYNEQAMRPLTGPGYFIASNHTPAAAIADPRFNEVVIDYTQVPPSTASLPQGWPAILPNSARLSRFIYNGTKDYLRRVSEHVTIGRAARAGRDMDNWFVLVRED